MDKAAISELRARLREAAERETRPRRSLLSSLQTRPTPAETPAPTYSARRVGLTPSWSELTTIEGLTGPAETGRSAFGQRRPLNTTPLLLPAPELDAPELDAPELDAPELDAPDASEPEPTPNRWMTMLAAKPAAVPAETPYHPEDFSDHAPGGAERLYAAAGLTVIEPRAPEAAPPPPVDPQAELLMHLERVFVAERAGLDARRFH